MEMRAIGTCMAIGAMMSGCANAPSISVLGAFFPDWMFCIVGAIFLTILVHHMVLTVGWIEHSGKLSLALMYVALTALFAFAGWLLLFQN